MHTVLVYSTPTCPYCKMTKAYLEGRHIVFTNIDVSADDAAAAEMIQKSGQYAVPVIDIDGQIVVGFSKEGLDKLLS